MLVPIFAGQNLIDAISLGRGIAGELGAEETSLMRGVSGRSPPADVGVAVVQLTDQLADEIGEIVAVIHERNQRGILVAHRFPIDAVHVRRVKEIAHVPPGFVVDLVPLGVAIELHVEAGELQLVVLGLELVLGQIDDGVILLDLDQHLLAVGSDLDSC